RGIWRTYIHDEIIDVIKKRVKTVYIIVYRLLVGRHFIFTDIPTDNQLLPRFQLLQTTSCYISPLIIKTHPVYQSFIFYQPKHPRLIISRLWAWRNRTNFNKTKAHAGHLLYIFRVLIEACR